MGIQSTQYLTREEAIDRITEIANLIKTKNYRLLDQKTFETNFNLQEFVDNWEPIDLTNINNWTDRMLEDYIDKPFFRHSLFENYVVDIGE